MKRFVHAVALAAALLSCPFAASAGRPVLRSLTVKTDVTRIGHYSGNFALETDLGDWFSLAVPFYWSLVMKDPDYGAWKADCLYFAPEARFWFKGLYDGFFAGVHVPVQVNDVYTSKYPSDARIGTTTGPFGAGLGGGYRFNLPGRMSWLALEAGLGVGYYGSGKRGGRYAEFIPDYRLKGLRYMTPGGEMIGLDQAYLSVVVTIGKHPRPDYQLHLYLNEK